MTEAWQQQVQRIVREELAQRGWKLVADPESFAAQVCTELGTRGAGDPGAVDHNPPATLTDAAIKRATVRNYCRLLYAASGETGSQRQSLAYRELWRYLYPVALAKTHREDLAQDLTQKALIKLWSTRQACREPEALLALATTVLVNSWNDTCRHDRVLERAGVEPLALSEIDRADDGEEETLRDLPATDGEGTLDALIRGEAEQELAGAVAQCIANSTMRTVVLQVFMHDREDHDVARELALPVGHVRVLKHRALAKLRTAPSMAPFVADGARAHRTHRHAQPGARRPGTTHSGADSQTGSLSLAPAGLRGE